eukprot:6134935-Pleurochrysis_carterae.AAC.1
MAAWSERPSGEFHRSCWGRVPLPILKDSGVESKLTMNFFVKESFQLGMRLREPVELDLHEPGGHEGGAEIRMHGVDNCEGFNCAAWVGCGAPGPWVEALPLVTEAQEAGLEECLAHVLRIRLWR